MTEVFSVELESLSDDYCGCEWSSTKKSYGLFSSVVAAIDFILDKDEPIIRDVLGGEDWLLNEPHIYWSEEETDVLKPELATITVKDVFNSGAICMVIDIKKWRCEVKDNDTFYEIITDEYEANVWVPGSNRKLYKEYRRGRREGVFENKLILLVRLYSLGQKSWAQSQWPTTWGVSYYRPKHPLAESAVEMHGDSCEPAFRINLSRYGVRNEIKASQTNPKVISRESLKNYTEYKQHFWTQMEAENFYDHLVNEVSRE